MKQLFTLLILLCAGPNIASSQVQSGELTFLYIDSVSYQHNWRPGKGSSDTMIVYVNGKLNIYVLDDTNYKNSVEHSRDTVSYLFTPACMLSDKDRIVRYFDLKNKRSDNYLKTADGYQKVMSFRMYESYRPPSSISDVQIDRQDKKIIAGVEGFKLCYLETIKGTVFQVSGYVTEDIQFPFQLYFGYNGPLKICPLYMETIPVNLPGNKKIVQLLSVKKQPKATVAKVIASTMKMVLPK